MKKLSILLLLSIFFVIGCNEENSVLEPQSDVNDAALYKGRPILDSKLYDDADLDFKLLYDGVTKTFSILSKNFTVDGKVGDEIFISESVLKSTGFVSMTAKLTIPERAFKGKLTFDIIFDFDNYSVELYPSPFTFDKPVILDLTFTGVDFTNLDADNLVFDYLDGASESLKYSDVIINQDWKILSIKGVEIPHFSRYGWVRTK
jgi:hypothetical protein